MVEMTMEQNNQRMRLEQWEHKLHAWEMEIMEREIKLLMKATNQERLQQETPKVQKRSGHFLHSLFVSEKNNGSAPPSQIKREDISSPTSLLCLPLQNIFYLKYSSDFRLVMSIPNSHHHYPAIEYDSTAPTKTNTSTNHVTTPPANPQTSKSTPTTPNLSRLRTLTCMYFD